MIRSCEICYKEFVPTVGSKGRFCSGTCSSKGASIQLTKRAVEKYNDAPKLCKECSGIIPYNHRTNAFCSRSCSGKHNNTHRYAAGYNMSEAAKHTIADKAKARYSGPRTRVDFVKCEECNTAFVSHSKPGKTSGYTPARFCSHPCRTAHRSRVARNNPGLGTKRSKLEMELYDLCEAYFMRVSHNEQLVDGWDADIIIHDTKTAVLWNGPWHYRDMKFGTHSLAQVQNRDAIKTKELSKAGWNVVVFEDRYYTPQQAFDVLVARVGNAPTLTVYETDTPL